MYLIGSMPRLQEFLDRHPKLATEMLEKSDSLWLISGPDGRVYWANESFHQFIGYSQSEFLREKNPILWTDFTVKDDSLESDIAEAKAVERGEYTEYRLRKYYIPKNSGPVFVSITVRRFPPEGDFDFFIVEVFPLSNESANMAKEFEKLAKKQMDLMESQAEAQKEVAKSHERIHKKNLEAHEKTSQNVEKLAASSLNGVWQKAMEYPKVTLAIILIVLGLLAGQNVAKIFEVFTGGGD